MKQNSNAQPKTAIQEADALINGQRRQDYGDALENFSHIAAGFNFVLAKKLTQPIEPEEVAMMMQTLKMARSISSPGHHDSVIDNIGYAGLIAVIKDGRASGAILPGILGGSQ